MKGINHIFFLSVSFFLLVFYCYKITQCGFYLAVIKIDNLCIKSKHNNNGCCKNEGN